MKIALIGHGKMGRMIEEIALSRGHEIVSVIDVDNLGDFDSPAFISADVAIEFTAPQAAYANCLKAFSHNVKVVSGTTGWLDKHIAEISRMCSEEGQTLLWSSNFSLGVAVFRALNRSLARIMNSFEAYTPSLQETHHIHKLDHPSGTAITLAEDLVAEVNRLTSWQFGTLTHPDGTREGNAKVPSSSLRIDSERRGEVAGIHSITWDSEADSITITHDAHSRRGFALGAVIAAEYASTHQGLLSMADLFPFTDEKEEI